MVNDIKPGFGEARAGKTSTFSALSCWLRSYAELLNYWGILTSILPITKITVAQLLPVRATTCQFSFHSQFVQDT
jgi:hypothetical protein